MKVDPRTTLQSRQYHVAGAVAVGSAWQIPPLNAPKHIPYQIANTYLPEDTRLRLLRGVKMDAGG